MIVEMLQIFLEKNQRTGTNFFFFFFCRSIRVHKRWINLINIQLSKSKSAANSNTGTTSLRIIMKNLHKQNCVINYFQQQDKKENKKCLH